MHVCCPSVLRNGRDFVFPVQAGNVYRVIIARRSLGGEEGPSTCLCEFYWSLFSNQPDGIYDIARPQNQCRRSPRNAVRWSPGLSVSLLQVDRYHRPPAI